MARICDDVDAKPSKVLRGCASQFYVAAELCRRGCVAVVTLGNCPNTDVLCSDVAASSFAHIQVKTFRLGTKKCAVGLKAEDVRGPNFFWVLVGLSSADPSACPEYYVIPASDMYQHVHASHELWKTRHPGRKNDFRAVQIPPDRCLDGWDLSQYKGDWERLIKCVGAPSAAVQPITNNK